MKSQLLKKTRDLFKISWFIFIFAILVHLFQGGESLKFLIEEMGYFWSITGLYLFSFFLSAIWVYFLRPIVKILKKFLGKISEIVSQKIENYLKNSLKNLKKAVYKHWDKLS